MGQTSYREALEVLSKYGKTLRATDFHPDSYVMIHHEEGTTLFYASAFMVKWKDWIFVYAEHHGDHAFHQSDLSACHQFKKMEPQRLAGTGYKDICSQCGLEFFVEELKYSSSPIEWNEPAVICSACLHKLDEEEE